MTAHHDDDDDLPPAIRAAWRGGRIVDDLTSITDRRTEDPGRRTGDAGSSAGGLNPDGWARVVVPILMAAAISALMSWIVADSTARDAVRDNITQVKTTEQNHFEEVLRRLDLIQRWQDRQDSRRDPR